MRSLVLLPLTLLSAPVLAQDLPDAMLAEEGEAMEARPGEIVVTGERFIGQVDAPQPPIATYDEADIEALGVSSLTDLLAAVSPQTGSGRGRGGGRPVILLNGQRVSDFREMRNFPSEAVRRMEVLPEEVALRYGFRPDQRVVNMILKSNFASKTVDGEYNIPTRGGFGTWEGQASLMRIDGANRLNLAFYVEDTSLLTEAERGVIQSAPAVPGAPDPAAFRSLLADTRDMGLNGTWSKGLGERGMDGSISLNASIFRNDSQTLSGLRTLDDPLTRTSRTETAEGGATLNKLLGNWQLNATLNGSHAKTNTLIDRIADAGADRAQTWNDSATSLVTLTGRPLRLPAGEAVLTVKGGFAYTGLRSNDTRTLAGETRLKRGDLSGGVNIALPVASRKDNVLAGIGDLSLNFSAGVNRLSDFGTLTDWSAGLTWSPFEKLGFQASYIVNEAAPTLANLGNPLTQTFNVTTYDFARGENASITVINGGNRALLREKQRDLKLSATWDLPFLNNSNLITEYFHNRSNNVTASFPLLTPAIEAAFPGRAVRDASGRLVSIDRRPVTLGETTGSRLRSGLNISGRLGKARAGGRGGMPGGTGRGPGAGGGPPGGDVAGGGPPAGGMGPIMGMMGGGGDGRGRWNLSLYHTVRFSERVTVAPGGPVLDLLGGDALSGGGLARHGLELEGGGFYRGFGLRFNGEWTAPTRLRSSGAPGTSDLRFGSVFRLNMRIFSDLGRQQALTDLSPFFKGVRLSFQFDNILDSRQKVTDASGAVPLSYQPDYLDPKGRMIGIDFRKTF